MKKQLLALAAAWFVAVAGVQADTSYLLIQGGFGSGGATEIYKWEVNYTAGTLTNSQSLLNAVFGAPTDSGTTVNSPWSSGAPTYEYYTAGDSNFGIGYLDTSYGLFLASITINSVTIMLDSYDGWNSFVSGGGSSYGSYDAEWNFNLINGGNYPSDGSWYYSNDGAVSRTLADGSFDAWIFGNTSTTTGADVQVVPTTSNFADATVLNIPEPGSVSLLLVGLSGMMVLRRKRRV